MVSSFRFSIVIFGIFSAFAYLIFNIYNLQIVDSAYYSDRAEDQYQLAGFLEPHRGIIYFTDKDDNLIPTALNKAYPVIFAVPQEIDDAQEATKIISSILEIDEEKINKAFANKKALYKLLVKKATAEQVAKIKEVNLKGIYVDEQEFRFYPFGDLASHLLGFISPSKEDDKLVGRYGIEKQFNKLLEGVPGTVSGDKVTRPTQGEDLVLTIDRNIQGRAEEILKELIEKYKAKGGTVIVQDPKTGNILAMGNYPAFDPNDYSQFEISSFLNPSLQAIYEPGSIFKVINMSIGLDSKKITPDTTYYDSGKLLLNGETIRNWDLKAHGKITMTEVIEKSINTGSAFVARQVGKDTFYKYLVKFGLKEPTNIQLSDEVVGNIENVKKREEIHLATASFGQGISVTPIALISAVSAIANKGVLMKPNLLKEEAPQRIRRVINADSAAKITAMMTSAVKKARIAQIPSYKVAGKTGTAQVPNFRTGGYTDEVINTYIGFAPASEAEFTILIKIDEPAGAPLAGRTVVPAFRELAEFILNYYNIPPDDLSS